MTYKEYQPIDSINEIRNRTAEDNLETKLETVWLTKGYSKSSVKKYVTHLLHELEYQKESFKVQLKEMREEKERLLSEKLILSKQLEESVEALNSVEVNDSGEYIKTIDNLKMLLKEKENSNVNSNSDIINSLKIENKKLNEDLKLLYEKYNDIKNLKNNVGNEVINKFVYETQSEDFNRLKNENQMLQTEIISLTRSVQELNARVVLQTQKCKSVSEELEKERISNNNSIAEKTELQVRLASYVERFTEYQDQIEYLEKSTGILKRQLEEQRNKNRLLSGLDVDLLNDIKDDK